MDCIKNGYCMAIYEFTAYCVPFETVEIEFSIDTIPLYTVKFPNGELRKYNEPACGSGGMIIATIDTLYNKYDFNYSRNLFVECSDIDARCVYMTYLQLACTGVPAVIYQRDTLSMQTWQRWEKKNNKVSIRAFEKFKDLLKGCE